MGAHQELNDQELWLRAQSGDASSFGLLYERHFPTVYNFCFRRTAEVAAAEDLASVVFVEAWRGMTGTALLQPSVLPWLLGIAHNLLRNQWRAARRRKAALARLPPLGDTPDHADKVVEKLDAEQRMRAVRAALARLPRREQEVIELCVWAGLSAPEAADVLGVAVGTIHSRMHRGRARLQSLIREAPSTSGHEYGRSTTVLLPKADVMEVSDGRA
ncbi:RNA polymerase sigma factor [Catellatospora aurea]|uniref:RNA polymerase sigma factor n=1 Tax=Catellatospora aurea TaxID=1337874 RepID=A0ABW2H5K7_9ACTN